MKMKRRAVQQHIFKTEIRAMEEEGKKYLSGFIPYNSRSEDMGFYELIAPGAFTKSLQESKQIFALWSHSDRMVLGNTANGTLTFTDTPTGLYARVELNDTTYAQDAWKQIQSGNVTTMSFGFSTIKEDMDYENNTRQLLEVRLYEVSFGVPFPAYAETQSFAEVRTMIENMDTENLETIEGLVRSLLKDIEGRKNKDKPVPEPVVATSENRSNLSLYEAKIKLVKES